MKFTGSNDSLVDDSTDTPRMLGKPILETSSFSSTLTATNKILASADMSQYYIVDRIGVQVVYDPLVLGSKRRPTGQAGHYAFWRTGADAVVAAAIRVLALAA